MLKAERVEKMSSADIKAVVVDGDRVFVAGRDGKVRMCSTALEEWAELDVGRGYVNCLAIGGRRLFAGCQDGMICVCSVSEDGMEVVEALSGHTSNVCSLDVCGDLVVSGSWDCTARMWRCGVGENMLVSVEHPAAVWTARFVRENVFVTGCADKAVRVYEDGQLTKAFSYHTSCVRGIAVVGEDVVSVDNEGLVLRMSLEGRLKGHHATRGFMYDLNVFEDGGVRIACSGENGRVVVLDMDLRSVDEVEVPATSCWRVVGVGGRVYVGCSDGRVYVFSRDGDEEAVRSVESMQRSQGVPLKDGEFVSGGQKFRSVDGDVYQEVEGEWVFIGKGEGVKPAQHSFQVELENKYYTLSFDKGENAYEVADRFLRTNRLREEFRDDIVEFINKNFEDGSFKIHSTINMDGVRSALDKMNGEYPHVRKSLGRPSGDGEMVEKELMEMMRSDSVFVALDLFRYFVARGLEFNLSFVLDVVPQDGKEATTLVRLVTTLFCEAPFNLDTLHERVLDLKDRGMVRQEVLDDYFANRALWKRGLKKQ